MDRRSAAVAFRDSIHDTISAAEFGLTPHPAFSSRHRRFLAEFMPRVEGAWAGDGRLESWRVGIQEILEETKRLAALAKPGMTEEIAVRALKVHERHAALGYAWVPGYAMVLADLIQDVRFEWGRRASNVGDDGGEGEEWFGPLQSSGGLLAIGRLFDEVSRGRAERRFAKIEDLELAHLDFDESSSVILADASTVRFRCPRGCEAEREIGRVGTRERCMCGAVVEVPVPSLVSVWRRTKEAAEAALGIGRCRICGQVVQKKKGAVERAGFCCKLCAREGLDRFNEFIPETGIQEGDGLSFVCRCGEVVRAATADAGSLVACPSCGLNLWVPPPSARPARKAGPPVPCSKCGRKNRATIANCQYCGEAMS